MDWTTHILPNLLELRLRGLRLLWVYSLLFLACYYFANPLLELVLSPMMGQLNHAQPLIATHVVSPLFIPLKLAGYMALFLIFPLLSQQSFSFLSPALYKKEKRHLFVLLIFSNILFMTGIIFCYVFILPAMFNILVTSLPKAIHYMPDVTSTFDFMLGLLFIFGLCFQIPLLMILSVKLNWLTLKQLKHFRRYAIVLAFIIGMLLTPPDVFSQILLALPLWALYELGILLNRLF